MTKKLDLADWLNHWAKAIVDEDFSNKAANCAGLVTSLLGEILPELFLLPMESSAESDNSILLVQQEEFSINFDEPKLCSQLHVPESIEGNRLSRHVI